MVRFRFLTIVLDAAPRPILRVPAMLLGAARLMVDPDARRIAEPALRAIGRDARLLQRWLFTWRLLLQHEADTLLGLQASRLTTSWAVAHVTNQGRLPEGGAILVTPHHAGMHIGFLALSTLVGHLGFVASMPSVGINGPSLE